MDEGGGGSRVLGYHMAGAFFDCSEFVAVADNSEKKKGEKKNSRGGKDNEEEVNKSPSDGISADAGLLISSVHPGS